MGQWRGLSNQRRVCHLTAPQISIDRAKIAAKAADEKLGKNIAVIDVSNVMAITDVFVIVSADNERQVAAIVQEVEGDLTDAGVEPKRREGNRENRWVLLDYGNIVIHVQRTDQREHYGLDRLYHDCPLVDIEGIEPPERPGDWTNGINPRTVDSIDELPLAQKAPGEDEEL